MSEYQSKHFGNDHLEKMRKFEKLVLEVQNSNIEILKSMPANDLNGNCFRLENYYYLVGPNSNNKEISFGFSEDYFLPEELKKKLTEAFNTTFK